MRIINLSIKILYSVYDQNGDAKYPATIFSTVWGGGGALWDTFAHRSGG
jgi:hypothetical protein